jgi:hypothetical protein
MIETIPTDSPKIVGFKLRGRLHDEDYKTFVPALDAALAAKAKVRYFDATKVDDAGAWLREGMWSGQ